MNQKPRDWEEAFEQITDEKHDVLDTLDNIVTLWELGASESEFDAVMGKAREFITALRGHIQT